MQPQTTDNPLFSDPKLKRRLVVWKIFGWVVAALIIVSLIIYILPAILGVLTSDIEPIDDSDLRLSVVSIPDNENAYFDLIKISDALRSDSATSTEVSDILYGKNWNDIRVDEIVHENKEVIELMQNAASKSKFQDPLFVNPKEYSIDAKMPPLGSWRSAARLQALSARSLAKKGDIKGGIHMAMQIVDIGKMIKDSQSPLIYSLVGTAIQGIGFDAIQYIVLSQNVSFSNERIVDIAKYLNRNDSITSKFKFEYFTQNQLISEAMRSGSGGNSNDMKLYYFRDNQLDFFYYRPNETNLLLADWTRETINNMKIPCNVHVEPRNYTAERYTFPGVLRLYLTENAIGKVITGVTFNSFQTVRGKRCNEDVQVSATQLMFAMRKYWEEKGQYPTTLNELVPQYIEEIPVDPYDGNHMKYSPEKLIIYSTGEDHIDSGGNKTGGDWRDMPDPSFSVDFSTPDDI